MRDYGSELRGIGSKGLMGKDPCEFHKETISRAGELIQMEKIAIENHSYKSEKSSDQPHRWTVRGLNNALSEE